MYVITLMLANFDQISSPLCWQPAQSHLNSVRDVRSNIFNTSTYDNEFAFVFDALFGRHRLLPPPDHFKKPLRKHHTTTVPIDIIKDAVPFILACVSALSHIFCFFILCTWMLHIGLASKSQDSGPQRALANREFCFYTFIINFHPRACS